MSKSAKSVSKPKGRGGLRPGSGRPREPRRRDKDGVSWVQIRAYARLGADKADILLAMGIDQAKMGDPEFATAFDAELRRGQALLRIGLLRDHKRLRGGGDGSVNAVSQGLRQMVGWGRPDTGRGDKRPDDAAAIADASAIIRKVGV